jgi:hypothetical protein
MARRDELNVALGKENGEEVVASGKSLRVEFE